MAERILGRNRKRKRDTEFTTDTRGAAELDVTAQKRGQMLDDGQPEPGSAIAPGD